MAFVVVVGGIVLLAVGFALGLAFRTRSSASTGGSGGSGGSGDSWDRIIGDAERDVMSDMHDDNAGAADREARSRDRLSGLRAARDAGLPPPADESGSDSVSSCGGDWVHS